MQKYTPDAWDLCKCGCRYDRHILNEKTDKPYCGDCEDKDCKNFRFDVKAYWRNMQLEVLERYQK